MTPQIFNLIDILIFLKVPSFNHVYKWRLLQEKKLKKKFTKRKKIMSDKEIKKFVMFYERITRHMLKSLVLISKVLINIDTKHCLKSIKFR